MPRFTKLWKRSPSTVSIYKAGEESITTEEIRHLWSRCGKCGETIYREDVRNNNYICPRCGCYFRLSAVQRLRTVLDRGSFEEWSGISRSGGKSGEAGGENPLLFPGYGEKLEASREKTGLAEAVVTGRARIQEQPVAVGACDSRFLMGSMGTAVGEAVTSMVERAAAERLPVVLFCCSGGARMQEGILSLMQMAKTAAALKRHSEAGLLSIMVLTDPTTGGVTASFAMLGDIILAEPGALIGFAGPRVIEQTIHQKLPEGFQRSEFLLEHGFVDKIVERGKMRETLGAILKWHAGGKTKDARKKTAKPASKQEPIAEREADLNKTTTEAWDVVLRSRQADRLRALDYIGQIFDEFIEFHGDRSGGDDKAIVGGVALLDGKPVTVIGQQKGKTLKENRQRNFGMPSPEGYRKAMRLMKQAEKFGRPIFCFVDTPGAFCGLEAEENGQGQAIAESLFTMADLKVPVLSVVIGEGGSGGALAMAVANEVWMMENAIYSVLSPEGFASILWKDSHKAKEAADIMRVTAADVARLGVVEKVIAEPVPACEGNLEELGRELKEEFLDFLRRFEGMDGEGLRTQRYKRFRKW